MEQVIHYQKFQKWVKECLKLFGRTVFKRLFFLFSILGSFILFPIVVAGEELGGVSESLYLQRDTPEILEENNTFFWQIDGGAGRSYLLGTLHVGGEEDRLPNTYRAALLASDLLITEVMAEDYVLGNLIEGLAKDPLYSLEKKLGTLRFEALYERLKGAYSKDKLQGIQPWAALNIVENQLLPEGLSWERGLDYLLIQAAQEYGKKRLALENIDQHLRLLISIPEPITIRAIDRALLYPHILQRAQQRVIAAYRDRDIPQLVTYLFLGDREADRLYAPQDQAFWQLWKREQLLTQRNERWLPKIVGSLNQTPTFIAVGVGHLYGEKGLIKQLRQLGFILTPIYLP